MYSSARSAIPLPEESFKTHTSSWMTLKSRQSCRPSSLWSQSQSFSSLLFKANSSLKNCRLSSTVSQVIDAVSQLLSTPLISNSELLLLEVTVTEAFPLLSISIPIGSPDNSGVAQLETDKSS